MDTSYPHQEGRKRDSSEQIHHPEFIIIEEEGSSRQKSQGAQREKEGFASFEELTDLHFPFSIRVISLGLSVLMLMSALAATIGLVFSGMMTLMTLGYFDKSKELLKRSLSWWKKSMVLTIGFFFAFFAPSFGFTLIIVYFLILGERISHEILRKMLQSATK